MSPRLMDELMSDRAAAREFVLRHCVLGNRFALDGEMIKNTAKLGDAMTGGDRMVRRVTFQSNRPHIAGSSIVIDNRTIGDLDPIGYALLEKLVRAISALSGNYSVRIPLPYSDQNRLQ